MSLLHRIVIALVMLIAASYLDIRSREVPHKFWIPFFIIGVSLTVYDFYMGTPGYDLLHLAFAIGLVSALSWAAYFLNLYGGADWIALTVLSFLFPIYSSAGMFHSFGALAAFTNSVLLSGLLPMLFLLVNLFKVIKGEKIFEGFEDSRSSKIKAMFLGTRKKHVGRFDYSLEKIVDGKRKFNLAKGIINEDFATGKDMWTSPGIPLLVLVLAGFIVTILFGDLLFTMISSIFRLVYRM